MTPRSGIVDGEGRTLGMFLTKPPSWGKADQEVHLLKLSQPPEDLAKIFHTRPPCSVHTLCVVVRVFWIRNRTKGQLVVRSPWPASVRSG